MYRCFLYLYHCKNCTAVVISCVSLLHQEFFSLYLYWDVNIYFFKKNIYPPLVLFSTFCSRILPVESTDAIQAIWSPHSCLVEQRKNRFRLEDAHRSNLERCVTFDGPSLYSEIGMKCVT